MTERLPASVLPKRRSLVPWAAGAVVVLGVIVLAVFGVSPEQPPAVDASLEPGLLDATDFPPEVVVATLKQDELRLPRMFGRPENVNPPECSELARIAPERRPAGEPVAVLQVTDVADRTFYVEEITRVDLTPEWDPRLARAMLAECDELTTSDMGAVVTLHSSPVEGIVGDGYANSVSTGEDNGITVAVAKTKVGDHIVMFIGISMDSVFDEDEFVRLANVANERVRARL